jgi:hypothetical protein
MSTNTTVDHDHCIDVCNSLLRGEVSAVETYDLAMNKFRNDPQVHELRSIRDEHARSVQVLRDNVLWMGGEPSEESGAWGIIANAVQGAANLIGENAAIGALIQGEEHGQSEYQEALEDEKVMAECKDMIRGDLLPCVHVNVLALRALKRTV